MSVFPLKRPSMILSERKKVIIDGSYQTVGLKSDGTVVTTDGSNLSGWSDIVAIACGERFTVGLKSDGTCVAVGRNNYRQCNVGGWRNIVAVACGKWHAVGLKSDGTVVAVGYNNKGQLNVTSWKLATYDKKGLLIAKSPISL